MVMMKKLICLVLVLLCVLFASCASPKAKTRDIVGEVNASSVAEIHIYAFTGDGGALPLIPNFGHTFISIKNLSNNAFNIGGYELQAGEEVSIGLWGQKASWSIWFNLETYYINENIYKNAVSVKREIKSAEEIEALSNYTKGVGKWTFTNNCTVYALSAWNLNAGKDKIKIKSNTPKQLKQQIKRFTTYETERKIAGDQTPSFFKGGELVHVTPK